MPETVSQLNVTINKVPSTDFVENSVHLIFKKKINN